MAANQINFELNYTLNRQGLDQALQALKQVQTQIEQMSAEKGTANLGTQFDEAYNAAANLQQILNSSWNTKLGQLDVNSVSTKITEAYGSVNQLKSALTGAGAAGQKAFNDFAIAINSSSAPLQQTHTMLNKIANTFSRTLTWGVASRAVNKLVGSIQEAWSYTKELDTSLNDIRIVTNKSAEEMSKFAKTANQAAKSLGNSTTEYTEASLIYYQQGLSDQEVQTRTDVTLKTSNVTGQSAEEVSEQLTAVWNGYQVATEEAEASIDVLAAVAASTASDLEELSTAMSKTASSANALGVSEQQLSAMLSTTISVTRQSAETVGNAYKTILARISDIESGLDDETTLGNYTQEMKNMGINVLDSSNNLRDMGDVIEEIGGKWSSMSREQQIALAQTMAGTRQYNNLLALFDNWGDYEDALNTASSATGTLEQQQSTYMESTAAHLETLGAAAEGLYDNLVDNEAMNTVIDGFTSLVSLVSAFVEGADNGVGVLQTFVPILANLFSNQIGRGLSDMISNRQARKVNTEGAEAQATAVDNMVIPEDASPQLKQAYQDYINMQKEINANADQLGEKERLRLSLLNEQTLALAKQLEALKTGQMTEEAEESDDQEELLNLQNRTQELETQNQKLQNRIQLLATLSKYSGKPTSELTDEEKAEVKGAFTSVYGEGNIANGKMGAFMHYPENALNRETEAADAARIELDTAQQEAEAAAHEAAADAKERDVQATDDLKASTDSLSNSTEQSTNETNTNSDALDNNTHETETNEESKISLGHEQTRVNDEQQRIAEEIKNPSKDGSKNNNDGQNPQERTGQGLNNAQTANDIAAITKTLSGLTIGINSVTNAIKIANNEDLSFWEKFQQITLQLAMSVPMLVSSLSSIPRMMEGIGAGAKSFANWYTETNEKVKHPGQAIKNRGTKIKEGASKTKSGFSKGWHRNDESSSSGAAQDAADAAGKKAAAAATNEQAEAQERLNNAETEGNILGPIDQAQDVAGVGTDRAAAEGKQKLTDKTNANTAANEANLASNLPLLLIMVGIAAVVAIAAIAIYNITKDYNALSKEAEAASETLTKVKDAQDSLNETWDSLKSAIDTYEEAKDTLDECLEGTEAWDEALQDTKEAAVELLTELSGLSNINLAELTQQFGDLYDSETGEFNEDVIDYLEDYYEQATTAASMATAYASSESTNATAAANAVHDLRSSNAFASGTYYETQNDVVKILQENVDTLFGLTGAELMTELQKLGVSQYIDDYDAVAEAISDLASSADSASITLDAIAKSTVDEVLGDDYSDEVKGLMARTYDDQVATETEYWEKALKEPSRTDNDNAVYKNMIAGLKAAGYDVEASTKSNKIQGSGDNRKFLLKVDGEEDEWDYSKIADILGASEATNNLADAADKAAEALANVSKRADLFDGSVEGIEEFFETGNFESLTEQEFQELFSQMGTDAASIQASLMDWTGLSADELTTLLGDDYVQKILDAKTNYETAWDSILDGMLNSTQQAFNNLNIDSSTVSPASGKYIAEAIEGSIRYGSEEGTEAIEDTFEKVSASGDLEEFVDNIDDISDWDSTSIEDMKDYLEDAGVATSEFTDEELYDFIQAMNDTSYASKETVSSLTETYSELMDIVESLSTGDTIEASDYSTLLNKVGSSITSFFTMMMDGTYKLTGDAEKFYKLVQQTQWDSWMDNIVQDYQSQITSLQSILNDNFNLDDYKNTENTKYTLNIKTSSGTVSASQFITADGAIADSQYGTDSNLLQNQIALIEAVGKNDTKEVQDAITEIEDALANGTISEQQDNIELLQKTINAMTEDDVIAGLQTLREELTSTYITMLSSSESMDELYENFVKLGDAGEEATAAFNSVWASMWQEERLEDLDSDELSTYANYIKETFGTTSDEARELAIQIMNMNDGIEDLADNYEDWISILNNSTASSEEYANAMIGIKEALSDILDIDEEFISSDFVKQHLDDIALAAEGDADAIDRLKEAAYEDIVYNIAISNDNISYEELKSVLDPLQAYLDNNQLEVGASIGEIEGSQQYIDSLNEMIEAAGLTSDQVQSMLTAMGYSVEFEPETAESTSTNYVTTTYHRREDIERDPDTNEMISWTDKEYAVQEPYKITELQQTFGTTVKTAGGEESDVIAVNQPTSTSSGSGSTSSKVKSLTKAATGSYNNYSSSNAGGGSSTGSDSKEDLLKLEDYLDLYHDINLELEEISTNLSRLQKQESKFVGQKLLDNLNAQLAELNNQIEATTTKIGIAQQEAATYQSKLASQGVTFDEDGYISNYSEIVTDALNYVNAAIEKYNNMSDSEQEDYKDTLDKIKEEYEDFIDMIEDYDTLISETITGLEDDIQDALDKQIEIQIEKFTMEVEVKLDVQEATKDWNEFVRKVLNGYDDDSAVGSAQQNLADYLSYYETGSLEALTEQLNGTIDQLEQIKATGTSSVYGDDEASALEDLNTYLKEMYSSLEDLEDLADDIMDDLLDAIDKVTEAVNDQVEQYEYVDELIEHDLKIIELLYGDDAYAQMAAYYEQQEANQLNQITFLRSQIDLYKQELAEATDQDEIDKWTEAIQDAQSTLNQTLEDSLQTIIDKYTNTINQIFDELNDKVTNGLGLDYIEEEWDLINQESDMYLDSLNAEYEVQSLQQKYIDAINDTDSVWAQKEIASYMEEQVEYLREKENLTEYDIGRAEKLYEIELARIALQEAQQNKSTMRLRRDASGNYSYQYVADEDAVSEAEQNLKDLENELYNMDLDNYNDNLEAAYDLWKEYIEKAQEILTDTTLSEEERQQELALIQEKYGNMMNDYLAINLDAQNYLKESAFQLSADLYDLDSEYFQNMTDEEIEAFMTELVPTWDSGVQEMLDAFVAEGGFLPTVEDAFVELDEVTVEYEEEFQNLQEAAGVSFDAIAQGIDTTINDTYDLIDANNTLIDKYWEEYGVVYEVVDELNAMIKASNGARDAAKSAAETAYNYWHTTKLEIENVVDDINNVASSWAAAEAAYASYKSTVDGGSSGGGSGGGIASDGGTTTTNGNGSIGVDSTLTEDGLTTEARQFIRLYAQYAGYTSYTTTVQGLVDAFNHVANSRTGESATYSSSDIENIIYHLKSEYGTDNIYKLMKYFTALPPEGWGYDTGGYTGDWNSDEGKIAMLHEKELVLNKADTENILNAVTMVRDISSMLDALDTSAFSRAISCLSELSTDLIDYDTTDTLEQDVRIEANFPNVTNSTEIETAFDNLVLRASQYANRKSR